MNKEQSENPEASPGAPGKNPEGSRSAAPGEDVEPRIGNLEEKGSEALPQALIVDSRRAGIEPAKAGADPFFSGRKHFPALDGLRGLAVLMVMGMHYIGALPPASILRFPWCEGWVGVDLFFVLSGFLITGILYDSAGQVHYFRNFYARRFLRIFPLYYGLLFCVSCFLLFLRLHFASGFAAHPERERLLADLPWLWTYTVNLMSSFGLAGPPFLSHFWSLAVEEQFYMVWPVVVFLAPRRRLMAISLVVMAIALLLRLALTACGLGNHGPVYDLMFCRMDAFGAGAIVVLLSRGPQGLTPFSGLAKRAMLVSGGFVLIALAAVPLIGFAWSVGPNPFLLSGSVALPPWSGSRWLTDALYSVLAVLFASVIGVISTGTGPWALPAAVLNLPILRTFGKYSYALYVFHVPIFVMLIPLQARIAARFPLFGGNLGGIAWIVLNLCLAFSAAFLSYHLYEKHFLILKKYFPERVAAGGINDQRSTTDGQ